MPEKEQQKPRRTRADGELSRERILDAATEIAAERGYEGTSIALVSKKCGLPASSIYWHFTDKDDLIAAVIERSFASWLAAWQFPDEGDAPDRMKGMAMQIAKALLDSPDFIRLGLMLALERRPEEPRARTMFLQARAEAYGQLVDHPRTHPGPHRRPDASVGDLCTRRRGRPVHRQRDRRRRRRPHCPIRDARPRSVRHRAADDRRKCGTMTLTHTV